MAIASALTEEEVGRVHGGKGALDFGRSEFLEIVHVERPRIIYKASARHFFFLAGLAVCTSECSDTDFESSHLILPWVTERSQ